MPSKQGGKGKQSSPSRKASHQRGPLRTAANKTRKMARHARRMGLDKAAMGAACTMPEFPRIPPKAEKSRVVLTGSAPPNFAGFPMHLVFISGVLVEITPHLSDAQRAKRDANTRHQITHDLLNPLTGRRTRVEFRPAQ